MAVRRINLYSGASFKIGKCELIFSKFAALFNLCAAFRFNPLPSEGGGPEGRGLGEKAAKSGLLLF